MHILDAVDIDFDFVANLQIGLLPRHGKFAQGYPPFGLQPHINDRQVIFDRGNSALDHPAFKAVGIAKCFFQKCREIVARGVRRRGHKSVVSRVQFPASRLSPAVFGHVAMVTECQPRHPPGTRCGRPLTQKCEKGAGVQDSAPSSASACPPDAMLLTQPSHRGKAVYCRARCPRYALALRPIGGVGDASGGQSGNAVERSNGHGCGTGRR